MINAMFIFTSFLILIGTFYVVPTLFILSFALLGDKEGFIFGILGILSSSGIELYMFWLIAQRIMSFI